MFYGECDGVTARRCSRRILRRSDCGDLREGALAKYGRHPSWQDVDRGGRGGIISH